MPLMPVSYTACSPASSSEPSTSARALSTTSSIRPGWMRPSVISRSRARRPTSRRTGSKHDTTTVSGVPSMMTSPPVAASNARMFRPSRPILQRPAALLETASTLFQATESLFDHLLAPLDLAATARGLLLECLARVHQLFLRREHDTLSGFPEQPFGLDRGGARRRLRRSALHAAPNQVEQHPCSDASAEEG